MKKHKNIPLHIVKLLSLIFIISSTNSYSQTNSFYFYKNSKIMLEKDVYSKYFLFQSDFDLKLLSSLNENYMVLSKGVDNTLQTINAFNNDVNSKSWAIIKSKNGEWNTDIFNKTAYSSYCFTNNKSKTIGVSHLFYVKIKNDSDYNILKEFSQKKDVTILGNNKFMKLWYTLSCENSENALDMSIIYHESGLFSASEPDLLVDDEYNCVTDPNFSSLWGLKNTGQNSGTIGIDIKICNAWTTTFGDPNITVAVLDQGIEKSHSDLSCNISNLSFDSESGTSPSQLFGDHGTHCAGIIAACKNGSQVIGVAPNCKLMAISNSLQGTINSRQKRADGINWAVNNGADIISNSWGSTTKHQIIDDAISNALNNGRG